MTTLAGPLLGLSFRRTGHHCGKQHTPTPPSNAERYRALLAVWPMRQGNTHDWQFNARRISAAHR